jgi:predicted ATPase with chaperone activity
MDLYSLKPHPCGYFSDPKHACRCTYQQIHRYRSKISGPLLDRIDIHVEVPAVPYKDLMTESTAEPSADIGCYSYTFNRAGNGLFLGGKKPVKIYGG